MHHFLRTQPTLSSSRRLLGSDKIHGTQDFTRFLLTSTDTVPPRSDICKPDLKQACEMTTAILEDKSYLKPFGQRREKIEVNGVRLNWDAVGTGEHVILLLPGAVGSIQTDFEPIVHKFDTTKYTIVSWDPPGYGLSRPPIRDFSGIFLRRDGHTVVNLMNQLGFDKYSILGWSNGGCTGGFIAADYPSKVHKLVTWGTHAYIDERVVNFTKLICNLDIWHPKMLKPLKAMYGSENLILLLQNWHKAISDTHEKGLDINFKECLKKIKCPVLAIHGEEDPIVGVEQAEYLLDHITNSKIWILPEAQHNMHLRHTDQFLKVVTRFLDA